MEGRRSAGSVAFALAGALVAGCASTGTMTGELAKPDGPPQRVTLSYVADRTRDSGDLSVTLPDGESFAGRYWGAGSTEAAVAAPGLDIDFSVDAESEIGNKWTFDRGDPSTVVALLQGSRGHKIRCRFTLLYPAGGVSDGGTGECQVSTGGRISVRF